MKFFDHFRESAKAIRGNITRAILTILVIAFGITALIGVHTSIEGVKWWMTNSLITLGSNTFRIENYSSNLRVHGQGSRAKIFPAITYHEAGEFKKNFTENAIISITASGNFGTIAKYQDKKTDPDLQLIGGDENYLLTVNYKIDKGRNLNEADVENMRNVVILGKIAENKLFPYGSPLDKTVQLNGKSYRVIGTFGEMGSAGMMGGDKICLIPVSTLRKHFNLPGRSFGISVYTDVPGAMEDLITNAKGEFRQTRKLRPSENDNFGIFKSDEIVNSLIDNLAVLTWAAFIIALITLASAAIGVMNIMLVSVTERTREIGIRKATGATRKNILRQFLTEATMICQLGGLVGIIFGVSAGNIVGVLIGTDLIIPWDWVIFGLVICTLVGLFSGVYPAWKAASVDPIESLRYE